MKYKKGDKVKVRSLDWYNANKNSEGAIIFNDFRIFDDSMSEFCGKVVTIEHCNAKHNYYDIEEDGKVNFWTDDMFEGLAIEEPQEKMISLEDACKWLKNTIDEEVLIKCGYVVKCIGVDDFVEDFRKAMRNNYMGDKFEEYLEDCAEVGEKIKSIREDERKHFLNKARKWIEDNIFDFPWYDSEGEFSSKDVADAFCKAMEE